MLRVIAVIKDGKQTVGYRLYDEDSTSIGNFSVKDAYLQLSHYGCSNAVLQGNTLVCTDGSVNSLPVLDYRTLECVENDVVIVLGEIVRNNKVVGYKITDYSGQTIIVDIPEFLSYERVGYYNAKIVNRDGKKVVSAIKGTFKEIQAGDLFKNEYNSFSERLEKDFRSIGDRYFELLGVYSKMLGYTDYEVLDIYYGEVDNGNKSYTMTARLEKQGFEQYFSICHHDRYLFKAEFSPENMENLWGLEPVIVEYLSSPEKEIYDSITDKGNDIEFLANYCAYKTVLYFYSTDSFKLDPKKDFEKIQNRYNSQIEKLKRQKGDLPSKILKFLSSDRYDFETVISMLQDQYIEAAFYDWCKNFVDSNVKLEYHEEVSRLIGMIRYEEVFKYWATILEEEFLLHSHKYTDDDYNIINNVFFDAVRSRVKSSISQNILESLTRYGVDLFSLLNDYRNKGLVPDHILSQIKLIVEIVRGYDSFKKLYKKYPKQFNALYEKYKSICNKKNVEFLTLEQVINGNRFPPNK